MKTRYILTTLALTASLGASAQALHGQVDVEGKYAPEVIVRDKIATLPETTSIPPQDSELGYSLEGVATDYEPGYFPLPAMGWRDTRKVNDYRGYLDAGLGSWLNSELSAGYRFLNTKTETLGTYLQFNSSSLYKFKQIPYTPIGAEDAIDVPGKPRQIYDGTLAVYGSRYFRGVGLFSGNASYRCGYFNYFSTLERTSEMVHGEMVNHDKAPTQTLTDVNVRLMFDSPVSRTGVTYHAGLAVRHFGFRAGYRPMAPQLPLDRVKGTRETLLHADGGFYVPWQNGSSIGMNADLDVLMYGKGTLQAPAGKELSNSYGNIRALPYYRFKRGLMNVKIGAEVDLTFNAGYKGERFSVFHIAPNLLFDYRKNYFGIYFHYTGGTQLQTLAAASDEDYYCMPYLMNTKPVFSLVDLKTGVSLGPFSGFSIGASIAYKITNNVTEGGWYPYALQARTPDASLFHASKEFSPTTAQYGIGEYALNITGWSVGMNLRYELGTLFSIQAEASYQPQKGYMPGTGSDSEVAKYRCTGFYNGLDRPRWIVSAKARTNPWRTLNISTGFDLRGNRHIYTHVTDNKTDGAFRTAIMGYKLPDIILWNVAASYEFSRGIGVWGKLNNLLNRKDPYLPCQAAGGVNFVVGINVKF